MTHNELASCADWLRDARWGVFTHYLESPASSTRPGTTSADAWNRRVDAFDVEALARQLASVGAAYYGITIGQNSGHYCAPNATYDAIVGRRPSLCSRRDLIADLHAALEPRGIRLLAYLPGGAPACDALAVEKFEWQAGNHRLAAFQRKWEAVIREWSLRWGPKVSAWWIDGCFHADAMYRHEEAPNWASLTAALKAGNRASIVAYNPGGCCVPIARHSPYEDYTAGELTNDLPVGTWGNRGPWLHTPIEASVEGAQYHVLNFLGEWWGQGEPRFPDELIVGYTRYLNRHGGVVTWDVPIGNNGRIPAAYIRQLRKIDRRTAR